MGLLCPSPSVEMLRGLQARLSSLLPAAGFSDSEILEREKSKPAHVKPAHVNLDIFTCC